MTPTERIPFNKPFMTGRELSYIAEAHLKGRLAGDGDFTQRCRDWLERETGSRTVLLTHSCTAALEMAALALDIRPGDEVIMPSYTFVSTANAFALRGATPVFVDIREDTLNLDENLLEAALTKNTRAIVPVHYAGVACEMDAIKAVAAGRGIPIVEDAAQGFGSLYKGQPLGSIGDLGTYSFHETKNVISGEGGALLVNDPNLESAAEIIREKGTNRTQFFKGEADKYTWQSLGSSFLPGEIIAAFLLAQLESAEEIKNGRLGLWNHYHECLRDMEEGGRLRRPVVPEHTAHNAHMYYILLDDRLDREKVINSLDSKGIHSVFHYVPLHQSPGGLAYCRQSGSLKITESLSSRLLRLPLWMGMTNAHVNRVAEALRDALKVL